MSQLNDPVLATRCPDAPSRRAFQSAWRSQRGHGAGAVIAAFADAATLGHFDWRRPGHACDPVAFARARYAAACRNHGLG